MQTLCMASLDEVGQRVLQTRLRRGMSQERLAALADTNRPTIKRVESGKNSQVETILRIADALAVSPGYLLGEGVDAGSDLPDLGTYLARRHGLANDQIAAIERVARAFQVEQRVAVAREHLDPRPPLPFNRLIPMEQLEISDQASAYDPGPDEDEDME